MDASWNELLAAMLRPERPLLARCRARAEAHARLARREADAGARALADCRARIEVARASVFDAGDGVVDMRMTALEREWLELARAERSRQAEAGKRDAAVTLASDPEGVRRAEACALRLREVLTTWGLALGSVVSWRVAGELVLDARAETLLERPLAALTEALASTYGAEALAERASREASEVLETAQASPLLSTHETLLGNLALVVRVDFLWRACAVEGRLVPPGHPAAGRRFDALESPTRALLDLWRTGYVLSAIDEHGITLRAFVDTPPGLA